MENDLSRRRGFCNGQRYRTHTEGADGRRSTARSDKAIAQLACSPLRAVRSICQTVSSDLGKQKNATNEKAKRVLGWTPRSNQEAIVATATSLIQLGLLQTR